MAEVIINSQLDLDKLKAAVDTIAALRLEAGEGGSGAKMLSATQTSLQRILDSKQGAAIDIDELDVFALKGKDALVPIKFIKGLEEKNIAATIGTFFSVWKLATIGMFKK